VWQLHRPHREANRQKLKGHASIVVKQIMCEKQASFVLYTFYTVLKKDTHSVKETNSVTEDAGTCVGTSNNNGI
jgi:hypothetical protein